METSISNVAEARKEYIDNFNKGAKYLCRKYLESYDLSRHLEEVVREGRSYIHFSDVMREKSASINLKKVWLAEVKAFLEERGCKDCRLYGKPGADLRINDVWNTDLPYVSLFLTR